MKRYIFGIIGLLAIAFSLSAGTASSGAKNDKAAGFVAMIEQHDGTGCDLTITPNTVDYAFIAEELLCLHFVHVLPDTPFAGYMIDREYGFYKSLRAPPSIGNSLIRC